MRILLSFLVLPLLLLSCSPAQRIAKAQRALTATPALRTATVGISIYDPEKEQYRFNYQGDKYFVPASNTKLATCYVAMKYLGDSLPGLRYRFFLRNPNTADSVLVLYPTGDPSFLLSEFAEQPVYDFLKKQHAALILNLGPWREERWGPGWAWNDYSDDYMAERSLMPLYGNLAHFSGRVNELKVVPRVFLSSIRTDSIHDRQLYPASIHRDLESNTFHIERGMSTAREIAVPFDTRNGSGIAGLLADTLQRPIDEWRKPFARDRQASLIRSQPTDSLLKPMMHRSDNFFAEQSLLMVSNELLGYMNDAQLIDTLLRSDYADLPQKPRWVDGSGLSRYNLFTPQDFVAILNKMRTSFGMERMQNILATGGTGTLSSYYRAEQGRIFAKTGSLSGVIALSGYIYTKKKKLLIFSILVNNHNASATDVRRAVEKFVEVVANG